MISCNAGRKSLMPFAAMTAQAKSAAQSSALCHRFAADQRDRNADERSGRSERVAAMMPGVGLDGGAFHVVGRSD